MCGIEKCTGLPGMWIYWVPARQIWNPFVNGILDVLLTEVPDDGMSFDEASLTVESIREDVAHGGVRVKFRGRLGSVRIPIQVDIGFGDVVVPGPEIREFPPLLTGSSGLSLRVYPVCTVISEKFEALVRLDAQNTRMKDFFDLELLLTSAPPDRELLYNAIRATFQRRNSELPAGVPTGLIDDFARDKEPMWNAFLRRNGLPRVEFAGVIRRIRKSLEWIWME